VKEVEIQAIKTHPMETKREVVMTIGVMGGHKMVTDHEVG